MPATTGPQEQQPGDDHISMQEFLAYCFHSRTNESNHIFLSGKLFFEYLVDFWAICEQQRLNYIRNSPKKLCIEQYSVLRGAVEQNPQLDLAQIGTRIILPSSFTGSTRYMQATCQNTLAINCYFNSRADFFLTITANPHWPEVKAALLSEQKPEDCPDIICHVFHAK